LRGPGVAETLDAGPDGGATVVVQIEGRLDLLLEPAGSP
jgi:hypothetical protein